MSSKKQAANFLKGVRSYAVAPGESRRAIKKVLQSLDCPRSLTVWLLYSNNEHQQLVDLDFDPTRYDSLQRVRDAYAATKLLSKFKGLTLDRDKAVVALEKFDEFELLCKQTNKRFRNLACDTLFKGDVVRLHNAVVRKIARILGDYSTEEFFSGADWGPGASTLIKRRDACSAIKFQSENGITADLYSLLPTPLLMMCYPSWGRHLMGRESYPTLQMGCKVITVPKDAKTDRVIAIEPGMNLWFQKSLGSMINKRLLRVGIDLRDQSRNQQLARRGSITNLLATVDLSSASDSISIEVVRALMPPNWFQLLESCRSPQGFVHDKWLKWEKFSSMGNGFTFALESLIFYAVAVCCAEDLGAPSSDVGTYGDDVIIPTKSMDLFSKCMRFYGFRINETKSHWNSAFRESCGAHYYLGFDVKPIYLKDELTSLQTVYRLANAVRLLAHRRMNNFGCDKALRPAFDHLVQLVPQALRLRVPVGLGDGGFVSNFDEASPVRLRHGHEGFRVRHLTHVAVCHEETRIGYHLAVLWRLSKRSPRSTEAAERPTLDEAKRGVLSSIESELGISVDAAGQERNSVPLHQTIAHVSLSSVSRWPDLGPWY